MMKRQPRDAVEEMALALYDHFNPRPDEQIKVGKATCVRMAEAAFIFLKEQFARPHRDVVRDETPV